MKACIKFFGLLVVVAGSICLSDVGFAQESSGQNLSRSSGSASGKTSSSRSVSFMKDGKRVAITENSRGISVSTDGRTVRAANMAELKQNYPDAFRLYEGYLNNPKIRVYSGGGGSARGGASAGGRSSSNGGPGQSSEDSTISRNVNTVDNGKKISITQNKTGITVSINGKRVRAKNAADLKKRSPEAFKMYEKHMGTKHMGGTNDPNGHPDAKTLMQQELIKLRDQNADNPRLRNMIEQMMQQIPQ